MSNIRPRIKPVARRQWSCACDVLERRGQSPKHAYDRWLYAALTQALREAGLSQRSAKPRPAPKVKPKPSVKAEPAGVPLQRKPKRKVSAPVDGVVAAQRTLTKAGEYSLPLTLRLAHARAAAVQCPLRAMSPGRPDERAMPC